MAAVQAETGAPVLSANAQLMLSQLEQQQAQNELQIKQLEISNQPFTTRTVSALDPGTRAALKERAGYLEKFGTEGMETGFAIERERAKAEAAGAAGTGESEKDLRKRQADFGKDVSEVAKFKRAVSDLRGHLEEGGWGSGDLKTRRLRNVAVEALGRMQSGGAISEDEGERFQDLLDAWTAEGTLEKLDMVEALPDSIIENARRRYGDDAAAAYFRVPEGNLPSLGTTEVMRGASRTSGQAESFKPD